MHPSVIREKYSPWRLRFADHLPGLLAELAASEEPVAPCLNVEAAKASDIERIPADEKNFRFLFNEDAMATEKTADGIRRFAADIRKLEAMLAAML